MRTANAKGAPGTHKLHVVGLQSCFFWQKKHTMEVSNANGKCKGRSRDTQISNVVGLRGTAQAAIAWMCDTCTQRGLFMDVKSCYRSFQGHTTAHAVVVGLGRTAQAPIAWPRGLGLRYLGLDWTGLGGILIQELILVLGLTLVLALILL